VKVNLILPDGVYKLDGESMTSISTLDGGAAKYITYKLIVPTAYSSNTVPVKIGLSERYGKYAEGRTIDLALNQQMNKEQIVIEGNIAQGNDNEIQVVAIGSDVDKNIPQSSTTNDNTYVLIIANEHYKNQYVDDVPFAHRDGKVFESYCKQTLGIKNAKHIKALYDATSGEMDEGIEWITRALSNGNDISAIIYYSGHGIPDYNNLHSYLLPVDGSATSTRIAYSIDDLYARLGSTNRPVTVFLDACFSGGKRDGQMIAAAKGTAVEAIPGSPQGKTVVFTACQGSQTAGYYKEQQHSMFTYWLLKKMQESKGNLSYEDLNAYLEEKVKRSSFDEGKEQIPDILYGDDALDWKQWRLK
jgi:hypothetical protein